MGGRLSLTCLYGQYLLARVQATAGEAENLQPVQVVARVRCIAAPVETVSRIHVLQANCTLTMAVKTKSVVLRTAALIIRQTSDCDLQIVLTSVESDVQS